MSNVETKYISEVNLYSFVATLLEHGRNGWVIQENTRPQALGISVYRCSLMRNSSQTDVLEPKTDPTIKAEVESTTKTKTSTAKAKPKEVVDETK